MLRATQPNEFDEFDWQKKKVPKVKQIRKICLWRCPGPTEAKEDHTNLMGSLKQGVL